MNLSWVKFILVLLYTALLTWAMQQLSRHKYSSGMPVGTKFTAAYIEGWSLNVAMCGHGMGIAYHCVHACMALSASAFIEPSLHKLDFFAFTFRNNC